MVRKKKNKYPQFGLNTDDKTTQVVLGLFFLCLSLIFVLAFISFLFNWKNDFDILQLSIGSILLDSNIKVSNALGNIGAALGQFFIYKHIGVASFLIPFYLFVTGLQTFTNQYIINLKRLFKNTLFMGLWSMVFFGLFFSETSILSGYSGTIISLYLTRLIGTTGASLILSFFHVYILGSLLQMDA